MNISIFASIWSQNLWDELILKNEIGFFDTKYNHPNFRVFSYDAENPFFTAENVEYKNYFPIWIRNPKNIYKNVSSFFNLIWSAFWSDIIVIGGWGLFYDWESNNTALKQWKARAEFFYSLRKKVIFYGISIDIRDENNYPYISAIFSKADEIHVRDKYSQKLLKSLWIESHLMVDPVFSDNWERWNKIKNCIKSVDSHKLYLSDFADIDWEWKRVWVALRNLWTKKYEQNIKEILNYIVANGWELVYLPHSFHESDTNANDYEFLQWLWIKWYISESMKETYGFYLQKKIDICLAQRFHAMILSEVYDIPFVGMSYSQKTKSLLENKAK